MSDLHYRLAQQGDASARSAASRLASPEAIGVLSGRVRAGRRRRAALGASGMVAGLVIAAVGLWNVLPGVSRADWDPASSMDAVYDIRVDDHLGDEVVPAELDLWGEGLVCGRRLDAEPGVSLHSEDALRRAARVSAWMAPLSEFKADAVKAGRADVPTWQQAAGGDDLTWRVDVVLVDDGVVVGISGESEVSGPDGYAIGTGVMDTPEVGQCGESPEDYGLEQLPEGMVPVLVAQARSASDGADAEPLLTVVVDPREAPEPRAAEVLVEPQDGSFQTFLVDRPAPACNSLGALREAGVPLGAATSGLVDLDGVATMSQVTSSQVAFVDVAPGESWMESADAWVVTDTPDGGAQMMRLEWETSGNGHMELRLGEREGDVLQVEGCDLPGGIAGEGSVFLVIDAVEPTLEHFERTWTAGWPSLARGGSSNADLDGVQTWIYLGEL